MSSLKKIAWSGSAVLLALVMSLGVMAPTPAKAAASATSLISGTVWNGAMVAPSAGAASNLVVTEGVAGDFGATVLTLTNSVATVTWVSATCTISGQSAGATNTCTPGAMGAAALTITFAPGGTPSTTPITATVSGITFRNTANAAAGTSTIAATGTMTGNVGSVTLSRLVLGVVANTSTCPAVGAANAPLMSKASFPADSTAQGGELCAYLADAAGATAAMEAVLVSFTVNIGAVSTGTAKTTAAFVASGIAKTNYRGGGGQVATDTAIATQTNLNLVATQTISLTSPTGNTASKVTITAPTVLAVAAQATNTSPNYQSPTTSTNFSAQVTDSAGLGVNGQVVLLSTDKGAVATGFNQPCSGVTAKSITITTATGALTAGGTSTAGVVQATFCAIQTDAAGKATITAQNISTTMANATTTVSMAGRPSKIEATATGTAITAKVSDAGGNAVADGTPVRFTMSSNAGAVSTACTTSTNGAASAVVALIAATGTVIVSTDWNETGTAATCAAAGAQQVAASVTVPGGSASSGGGTAGGGTGALTSGSVPATGFGLIVFGGGTVAQLVTASAVGNSGALYATVGGNFVPYVPGTTIAAVNADFLAAFPGGNIPANTAFVGRK